MSSLYLRDLFGTGIRSRKRRLTPGLETDQRVNEFPGGWHDWWTSVWPAANYPLRAAPARCPSCTGVCSAGTRHETHPQTTFGVTFFSRLDHVRASVRKTCVARTGDREERKLLSRYTSTPRITNINPNLPASVVSIVERMMKVSPNDRYQSIAESDCGSEERDGGIGRMAANGRAGCAVAFCSVAPFELLVVDSRKKRKAALKTYFTKHGFRTSFVTEPGMALEKLKSSVRRWSAYSCGPLH